MKPVRLSQASILLFSFLIAGSRITAAELPPITDEERALTSVAGEPNAPAVILFKTAEFLMAGYELQTGAPVSYLRVHVRKKILTEEGKSDGEIAISHSDFTRLQRFEGRTVRSDGQVVPVPPDARFVRKTSRSRKTYQTAVAFPAVEVGAILDYSYELKLESILLLEPWYFSEDVPVRYSEIVFKTPPTLDIQVWTRSPLGAKVQRETEKNSSGYRIRAWGDSLPAVPDDAYSPPFADMAAQIMVLPVGSFFKDWPQACRLVGEGYTLFRWKDGDLVRRARELAGSEAPRRRAEILYRFVRDRIETEPFIGVFVDPDSNLAKILAEGRGDRAEKAVLLQAMLKAVRIGSRLVWAADRSRGAIDPQLPNPRWFDTVLVLVELDGQRFFLDPSDSALGFGQLRAGYEGTTALIHDHEKPETIILPETPFDRNLRRAEIDLALDGEGRLSGTGTLRLTGHHAWEKTDWQEDEAKTLDAWKSWLAASYRHFQISDLKVAESPDEGRVTLTWTMAEREEEVLGDEASVVPSAPLGPRAQPFVQPAASRRSPVMFDFPDREEVELRLRWPEGWTVDSLPRLIAARRAVGALSVEAELREEERSLVYRRRFDITRRVLASPQVYEAVRSLFAEVERSDAQALLLVRR